MRPLPRTTSPALNWIPFAISGFPTISARLTNSITCRVLWSHEQKPCAMPSL
ncbi:hypothetical protein BDZ97DRAFT_1840483 [Flammula alnicola]|nr:hypothetical protein BDZ97DRAFT_1840483 [Flammula alnicola]